MTDLKTAIERMWHYCMATMRDPAAVEDLEAIRGWLDNVADRSESHPKTETEEENPAMNALECMAKISKVIGEMVAKNV